ncbi:transport between ER and Golgi ATPase protein [Coemansia sp. Benny D115]|nr:transport between ER and Golgi ATPase protein [Coemansia sp. Benny D115]
MNRNQHNYERIYSGGEMDPYRRQSPAPPQYKSAGGQFASYMQPGDARRMKTFKCPDRSLTHTNLLAVSSSDFDQSIRFVRINEQFIFNIKPIPELASGQIGPSQIQREWGQFSINKEVLVEAIGDSIVDSRSSVFLSRMDVEISFIKAVQETSLTVDADEVVELLKGGFSKQIFMLGQPFVFDYRGNNLKGVVTGMAGVPLDVLRDSKSESKVVAGSDRAQAEDQVLYGVLLGITALSVTRAKGSLINLKGSAVSLKANRIIQPDFNFEELGIGGLDKEFSNIFRRAFASRIYPHDLVAKLKIQHVKGILLYGPPGTGKTLLARQIGKMLNAVEPLIVSGPEILNKFVGQSEENVRKLFEPAEKEYREKREESQLHIIIFDELDAICKQRGSKNDGTGTGDTVVNQLLAKMDGVDQVNNILIIGMTNRKELIDDALLRPGRLEVHIEVGLPDEVGRRQIIKIHTATMRENDILGSDVSIDELAALTKNYSGAEIAGVTRSAYSFALNRNIKVGTTAELTSDCSNLIVKRDDFMNALQEVPPAFGIASSEFELCAMNGIIEYAPGINDLLDSANLFVEQVQNSNHSPLVSVLLYGPSGSGKTALAATIAQRSNYPFVKLISPGKMVGANESQRISQITKIFNDSYKSPLSLIVIDDIEDLVEWVPIGPRFSTSVLQTLRVLIKNHPPEGRRLLVIGTTSKHDAISQMDIASVFTEEMYVGNIRTVEAMRIVLERMQLFEDTRDLDLLVKDFVEMCDRRAFSIGIKKLLLLIETARQDPDKHGRFLEKIGYYCYSE